MINKTTTQEEQEEQENQKLRDDLFFIDEFGGLL